MVIGGVLYRYFPREYKNLRGLQDDVGKRLGLQGLIYRIACLRAMKLTAFQTRAMPLEAATTFYAKAKSDIEKTPRHKHVSIDRTVGSSIIAAW